MRRTLPLIALFAIACGPAQQPATPAPIDPLPPPKSPAQEQPAPSASATRLSTSSANGRAPACADAARDGAGTTPRETIDRARAMLERRCYRELIETLVDRDDVAKITQEMPIDEIVKKFVAQDKQKDLRKVLDDSRDREPTIDPSTHVADYGELPHGALRLRETNGRWYIKN
jgi:hypothetical protein